MSKGSSARPFAVDRDTFASNFDAIFGKKKPERLPDSEVIRWQIAKMEANQAFIDRYDKELYLALKNRADGK